MDAVSRLARSCVPFFFAAASAVLIGCASGRTALFEEEAKPAWKESEPELPAFPERSHLIPLDMGTESSSLSYIDEKSLTLAEDGIVRFTLVVRSAGGAQNVSFEGVRCETGERKLYAIGRNDREWIKPRSDEWRRISDNGFNRQYALLSKDFFCPTGSIRPDRDGIVRSLRQAAGLR